MDMKYKSMLNAFALNVFPKTIPVPDFRLCIGEAERLDSVPVLLFTDVSAPSQIVKFEDNKTKPVEKFGETGDGDYISADDFKNDTFFESINIGGVI